MRFFEGAAEASLCGRCKKFELRKVVGSKEVRKRGYGS